MADVTIDNYMYASFDTPWIGNPLVWASESNAYMFFLNYGTAKLVYRKTEDGGATWGDQVPVGTEVECGTFSIWFDKWTPDDSGNKIHIVCIHCNQSTVNYNSLDTSDDSLSGEVVVYTGSGFYTTPHMLRSMSAITKSRAGNLYVGYWGTNNAAQAGFYKSENSGADWTAKTSMADGNDVDRIMFVPGNETDSDDIWCIYDDISANEISLKVYDQSGNSWSETSIGASTEGNYFINFSCVQRHSDNHVLLAFWNAYNTAAADLKFYDISSTVSITAKTDVLTDSDDSAIVCILLDQKSDDIYVGYLKGAAWGNSVGAHYKKSDDGGDTWESETKFSENTDDDLKGMWAGVSTGGNGASGKFQPVWFNDDLNDLFTNTNNGIPIELFVNQTVTVKSNIRNTTSFPRLITVKSNVRNTTSFPRSITAKGEHHAFVERFIGTTYKDEGNTTAYWDTTKPGIVRSPTQGEVLP